MNATMTATANRPAWKTLELHARMMRDVHLRTLFAAYPARGERLTAAGAGLFLDYSKNRLTNETMGLLVRLAEESGLRDRIDAMFRGDKINITENRAVLHVALRAPRDASIVVDSKNVVPEAGTRWSPLGERMECRQVSRVGIRQLRKLRDCDVIHQQLDFIRWPK